MLKLQLEGKSPKSLLDRHPKEAALLGDYFVWSKDPSAFPWQKQSAAWQQTMRMLSLLVWMYEQMAFRYALNAAFSQS